MWLSFFLELVRTKWIKLKGLVYKEIVALRRWESETQKFGFTCKEIESWG